MHFAARHLGLSLYSVLADGLIRLLMESMSEDGFLKTDTVEPQRAYFDELAGC